MDYKRIQRVLLIFFLLFNGYLVYKLFERAEYYLAAPQSAAAPTIEEDLASRGILFEPFSDEGSQVSLLVTASENILAQQISQLRHQEAAIREEGWLVSEFTEPIDLGLPVDPNQASLPEDFFPWLQDQVLSREELFIRGDDYPDFRYLPQEGLLLLRMTDGEGRPMVDGTGSLLIQLNDSYQMVGYVQSYQAGIQAIDTRVEVMAERDAISILDRRVETYIPDGSTIRSTQLGYMQSSSLEDFNVYSPTWEIVYAGPDASLRVVLVDAVRGTVVTRTPFVDPSP